MSTGGWIFLLVVAGLIIAAVAGYNKLVGLRQRSEEAWSDIDVQLKRRTDLIPNVVETVKGYAAPTTVIASMFRFAKRQYFELESQQDRQAPRVAFGS